MEQVLLSLQVMKMQRDIKGVHIMGSEFCPFLEVGLAIRDFIFTVISSSIFKSLCPKCSKFPEFSKQKPNICILNEFEGVYGHFSRNDIFCDTLYMLSFFVRLS